MNREQITQKITDEFNNIPASFRNMLADDQSAKLRSIKTGKIARVRSGLYYYYDGKTLWNIEKLDEEFEYNEGMWMARDEFSSNHTDPYNTLNRIKIALGAI